MDDIWGTVPTPTSADVAAPVRQVVNTFNPESLVADDLNHETTIACLIPKIGAVVGWSEELCAAAWELSNFVPPNLDGAEKNVFKDVIIPQLTASLVDDIKARNELERSFASIDNLAVAITSGATNIRDTKGSERAIAVAVKHITQRQSEIKSCTERLAKVSNSAIELFAANAGEILKIVGPKAADFAKQEAEVQDQIDELHKKASSLSDELAELQGTVEKYTNLYHAQNAIVNGAEVALRETTESTKNLKSLNDELEGVINNIPPTVQQTETKHRTSWLGLVRHSYTTTRRVANPNRADQVNYYTSIIQARNARLTQEVADATARAQSQQTTLSEYPQIISFSSWIRMLTQKRYKEKLTAAQQKYNLRGNAIVTELEELTENINNKRKDIEKIRQNADNVEGLIGLKGSVLLQCLAAIRGFSKAQQEHACLYQPVISLLDYILSLTDSSVEMLQGKEIDVFAGGYRLLQQVGFMRGAASQVRLVTAPNPARLEVIKQKQPQLITA